MINNKKGTFQVWFLNELLTSRWLLSSWLLSKFDYLLGLQSDCLHLRHKKAWNRKRYQTYKYRNAIKLVGRRGKIVTTVLRMSNGSDELCMNNDNYIADIHRLRILKFKKIDN